MVDLRCSAGAELTAGGCRRSQALPVPASTPCYSPNSKLSPSGEGGLLPLP